MSAGSPKATVLSIVDDEVPDVTISFAQASYSVTEGASVTVTVRLSADPERSVAVPISVAGRSTEGTAGAGDYTGVPMSLTFVSGETAKTITFAATDDDVDDDAESFTLSFGSLPSGVSVGTTSTAVVGVVDNDVPRVNVSFEKSAYAVAESDDDSTTEVSEHKATIKVQLDRAPERSVTVTVAATGQMGGSNQDFTISPVSLTFNGSETEKSFVFTATADSVDDDGETVRLALVNLPARVSTDPSDATSEAVVSIADDDDPVVTANFSAATYSAAEGGTVTVTVTLSADPERTVVIPLTATAQGGATAADDYSGIPASLTFNDGDTAKSFTFTATQDTLDDDGESVKLAFGTLPERVTAGTTKEAVVSIADDDTPSVTVSFGQASYTVAEGATVTVTLNLSADPEQTVTIPISKTNQNNTTDADYEAAAVPTSMTFNSGETSKSFTFTAKADALDDDDDSVLLSLGPLPTGVGVGTHRNATVNITDDPADVPDVNVSFASAAYSVAESDDTSTPTATENTVTVTVMVDVAPERELTIPLTRTNNGASSGDYTGVPATVRFTATDTSKTLTFTATHDTVDDDGESVTIGFGTLPTGVTAVNPTETTVSIGDERRSRRYSQLSTLPGTPWPRVVPSLITVSLSEPPERQVTTPD